MAGEPMSSDLAALFVHRNSRTELLATRLADALEAQRPTNPLAAQTIVVAHPGLRRWLLGEFARRPGPNGAPGIAANFDMLQPWQWLEKTAHRVLGDEALIGGEYQREMLRWRIYRALPEIHDAQIKAYLRDGELGPAEIERRRFQLAEYLAGMFSQYLIYRPDWIADWEHNSSSGDWQAEIWRQVRSEIAQPHRAERRDALLQALADRGDGEAMPLHVFGVSHLPPDILAALGALALHRAVHIYFPDPCHKHWSYLRGERDLLKRYDDPQALHFEVGHTLLVGLGRMAQDFCLALEDRDAVDQSNADDDTDSPEVPGNLLAQLQSSIRNCEPDMVGAAQRVTAADEVKWQSLLLQMRDDASLRIHACHTRLRELEVLKDALLARLAADPTLQHRDIVVMAPNIEAYAPYLGAVFGEPARFSHDPAQIPWHLADVGLASTHPLMSAFARLLDLPESRFAVSDIMDFLDVPAVARRFEIEPEDRKALERWLRRARVAWGLDAAMKEDTGAPAIDANSWKFGFDRLYAGLIAGNDVPGELLDGIFPAYGIGGGAIQALGGLDRLLTTLRNVRSGYARPRSLDAWCELLLKLIDAVFLPDSRDDRETSVLDNLRREIAQLREQSESTRRETLLPWSVMREAVRAELDEQSQRQPFLLGGVTFCGMVPQRSIPFRVVCVLGMNEGEFPRQNNAAGLNRMLTQPRSGDRDTRSEDRYLFLEALMAARDNLHISFIGESVRDGKIRNASAPLAELMQFLDERYGLEVDSDVSRPWLIRHPLQPFDARYFLRDNDAAADGRPRHDPRLFSFAEAFAKAPASPVVASEPFVKLRDADSVGVPSGDVDLSALKSFWRDPARAQLRDGAGLSLETLDTDVWPDREPLEIRVDRRERIERRLVFDALDSGGELPDAALAWLARSGILPAGALGERVWEQARERAIALLIEARARLGVRPARTSHAIDLQLANGARLRGVVDRAYRIDSDQRCVFDTKPGGVADFRELIPLYLDFAALRLAADFDVSLEFVECPQEVDSTPQRPALLDAIAAQTAAQLREGLHRLTVASHDSAWQPLLFFPKTAWAWAHAKPDQRESGARNVWEGTEWFTGERDYAPGYAALLTRDLDLFDTKSPAHTCFVTATELVAGVLDPERRVLMGAPNTMKKPKSSTTNKRARKS